jgi:hypothetical protein
LQESASALLAQSVAVTTNRQHMTVVKQPIEDRGCDHGIPEDRAPFPDRPVRGDEHGAALVTPADQLEEQVSGIRLERQVTELVDDQQLRFRVVGQTFLEPAIRVRFGELRDQRGRRREQHRVAGHDRIASDRHC